MNSKPQKHIIILRISLLTCTLLLHVINLLAFQSIENQKVTIKGKIIETKSKQPIIGSKIYINGHSAFNDITNELGEFIIKGPKKALYKNDHVEFRFTIKEPSGKTKSYFKPIPISNFYEIQITIRDRDKPITKITANLNNTSSKTNEKTISKNEKTLHFMSSDELITKLKLKEKEVQELKEKHKNDSALFALIEQYQRVLIDIQYVKNEVDTLDYINPSVKSRLTRELDSLKQNLNYISKQFIVKNKNYESEIDKARTEITILTKIIEKKGDFYLLDKKITVSLLGFLILLFFLFILASILLWRIARQNIILKQKSATQEILLREIHHRVRNNLQFILSLLSIQLEEIKSKNKQSETRQVEKEDTKDQMVEDALKKSKNRVLSIALVHEKLYFSDNLAKIDFREYIASLQAAISRIHSSKEINFQIEIQKNIHFDIDKTMYLGLIVNELILNSVKHAFPNYKSDAHIWIRLITPKPEQPGVFQLIVEDNGIGILSKPKKTSQGKSSGTGVNLVKLLIKQIEGEKIKPDKQINGTKTTIQFRE